MHKKYFKLLAIEIFCLRLALPHLKVKVTYELILQPCFLETNLTQFDRPQIALTPAIKTILILLKYSMWALNIIANGQLGNNHKLA